MANDSQPVTLPSAAEQAAHDLGAEFVLADTNALAWNGQSIDIVPAHAQDHLPSDVPPEEGLGLDAALIDTGPPHAEDHVPSLAPPDSLPQPALDNLSDTGWRRLAVCGRPAHLPDRGSAEPE